MKKLVTTVLSVALGVGMAWSAGSEPGGSSPYTRSSGYTGARSVELSYEGSNTLGHALKSKTAGEFTMSPRGVAYNTTSKYLKAPARVGASGGTMYGWVDYDADGTIPEGFVEVDLNGTMRSIVPVPLDKPEYRFVISTSFVREGKIVLMGMQQQKAWGNNWLNNAGYVYEYDMEGNQLSKYSVPDYNSTGRFFTVFAYDAEHDIIYGQTNNGRGYQVKWGSASGADPSKITWTANQENVNDVLAALTFNQVTGKIVGVKNSGEVVEIEPATGVMTKVGELPKPEYATAIAWSPYDGGYYYGLCTDAQCGIQLLNEEFNVVSTTDLGRLFEFMNFYTEDVQKIAAGAPGATEYLGSTFSKGSLSGSMKYRLPSATHGGTPILGDMEWTLSIDGEVVRRGNGAAGSEVEIRLENLSEGMHAFLFTTYLGGKEGRYNNQEFYVGNDTPVAPVNVKLTDAKVTWDPVSEGVHAGYVDADAVTYNVYLNGKKIAEGIKANECSTRLGSEDIIDVWEAAVEAEFDGKVSEQGTSNDIIYGEPMNLPVSIAGTAKESKLFTITDNNFSPGVFKFVEGMLDLEHDFSGFQYSAGRYDADDWLYLPPMNFDDADAVYEFNMNVFRTVFTKEESFEVKLLTDINPATAVATIMENGPITDNASNNFEHYQGGYFQVPAAGKYYVGIHMTSKASAGMAWFRNFSVEKYGNVTGSNPGKATDVSAVAAENGVLTADVTFTLPTTAINGAELPADAELTGRAEADNCGMTTVKGKPGETVTATIKTAQGTNNITVTVADAENHVGLPVNTSVFTGQDFPGLLDIDYDIEESGLTMVLSWEPLSKGANDGYVESTGVDYYLVYNVNGNWSVAGYIGRDVYECRVNASGSTPAIYTYGVLPVTVAGQAPQFNYISAIMCEPYKMPFLSDYRAGKAQGYTYNRANNSAATGQGDPGVRFPACSTPDNAKAYYCYPAANATFPLTYNVALSKVSTLGSKKATLALETFGGCCDEFDVYASANGVPMELVKTVRKDEIEAGPTTVKIELPAKFQNKGWVEITLSASLPQNQTVIIYSYNFYDDVDFDFGCYELSGPVEAEIGKECVYTAYLRNYGNKDNIFPGAGWKLTDDEGNVMAEAAVPSGTEAIAAGSEFTHKISFTPSADYTGNIHVSYAINRADDKDSNDARSLDVAVSAGMNPVITDLRATDVSYSSVDLEWTNPDKSGAVSESFEKAEPFTVDSESDMIGVFKRYDGDKAMRYTLGGAVDKIPNATVPASFVVWSAEEVDRIMGGQVFMAPDGDKYVVAFCPQVIEGLMEHAADDWLISPEVLPGSEVSLWIRPVTYAYGTEDVTVLYSTTTDDREEFKEIGKVDLSGEGTQGVWKQLSFTLPEGAKYFALHYTSYDKMGIVIDDIHYHPVGSDVSVTGFDIYRNGELIAGNHNKIAYTDAAVGADTDYAYNVVPLLSTGKKGLKSNTLLVRTTGIDGIETVDGTDGAEYYNLQGIRVIGKPAPGVYLRKAGSDVRKVVVAK